RGTPQPGGFTIAVDGNALPVVREANLAARPAGQDSNDTITLPVQALDSKPVFISPVKGDSLHDQQNPNMVLAPVPTTALGWLHLSVPSGITGPVKLTIDPFAGSWAVP